MSETVSEMIVKASISDAPASAALDDDALPAHGKRLGLGAGERLGRRSSAACASASRVDCGVATSRAVPTSPPAAAPARASPSRTRASSARDGLDHDDHVVDDEAGGDRQRHQAQVVRGCSRAGTSRRSCRSARSAPRQAGNTVARGLPRKAKVTRTTMTTASTARSRRGAPSRGSRSFGQRRRRREKGSPAGNDAWRSGEALLCVAIGGRDHVGARLALHDQRAVPEAGARRSCRPTRPGACSLGSRSPWRRRRPAAPARHSCCRRRRSASCSPRR